LHKYFEAFCNQKVEHDVEFAQLFEVWQLKVFSKASIKIHQLKSMTNQNVHENTLLNQDINDASVGDSLQLLIAL